MKFGEIYAGLDSCFDEETGEINVEMYERLQGAWSDKVEGIGLSIKTMRANANAIKAEKMELAKRQTALENKAQRLEDFLFRVLDGEKFETARVAISYKKSDAVIIDEILLIPLEFIKVAEPTADKVAIKAALKKGDVPGAHIEQRINMQIK